MSVRMKSYSYSYFLFFSLFITSCLKQEFKKVEILINNWEFREQGQEWFPAIVPGSVHLDLYSNNLIDDPFYRANENKLQWIEDKHWEYKAKFSLDQDFIDNIRESVNETNQLYLDAPWLCTTNSTDLSSIFHHMDNLVLNLSTWDTSSVTNMSHMFFSARNFNFGDI